MDEDVKMVFIINSDEDGKGKIAAKVRHATVSSTLKSGKKNRIARAWLASGQRKSVLREAPSTYYNWKQC